VNKKSELMLMRRATAAV